MLGVGAWKDEPPRSSPGRVFGSALCACSGTSPGGKPRRWRAALALGWGLGKFVRFSFPSSALDAETEHFNWRLPSVRPRSRWGWITPAATPVSQVFGVFF